MYFANRTPSRRLPRSWHRILLGITLAVATAGPAAAAPPATAEARAKVVGQPASLVVQPPAIVLNGPRAVQQVVVTGRYTDGSVRDLTPFCEFTTEGPVAAVDGEGFVL